MLKHWKRIIRDIMIILVLTFFGGFILGLAGSSVGIEIPEQTRGLVNIIFITISGAIIGYIIRYKIEDKFNYVTLVGFLVVIISLINCWLYDVTFLKWAWGGVMTIMFLWVGFALSSILVKIMKSFKLKEN